MIDAERMLENLKRMVRVPSVSGTPDEIKGAEKIVELLKEIPYFQKHPDHVKLLPLQHDPLNRSIVAAFLKGDGTSRKTVILTGHYDVVDVEEFGSLKDKAFDVDELAKVLDQLPMDEDCKKDYESGDWIFGRGTSDMKYGHALCLELLRYYSEKGLKGNIVYTAVCGEETNSEGMLRAVPFYNEIREKYDLDYQALLMTECYIVDEYSDPATRYIHIGASGKIMPMFFFVGDATHGDAPFMGLDPNLMASEVYRRLNMNAEFCQQDRGETTPVPVCLKNQDLKNTYSVSTPLYSASYYNIISVHLDPEKAMGMLKQIAEDSFAASLDFINEKADALGKKFGNRPAVKQYEKKIMTYSELLKLAEEKYSGDLKEYLMSDIKELQDQGMEMQTVAIYLVKKLYELAAVNQPCIIISLIPPYYPDVYPEDSDPKLKKLRAVMDDTMNFADKKYQTRMAVRDYYMGLSDLSYTGIDPEKNFDEIFENVAGVNQMYFLPTEDMKKFSVPGIVMGGYGKDFHKATERLEKQYNFHVLPYLYIHMIDELLD
ncbi:MAG: M20/M25/M40 family metallo-hydrolase [Eubacterium sp.]|jgi:arginine utilization protein RocB|nr:M20/M25/M40 family metallo-hydrolase [Eubacterium sp.]MCH4047592.1 M20/M25/M40 family metallo-hydrolase [Eubacterium sp.]MCH4078363.1 M20/M25/M40 family metallo-hydrolase [Eubacterium sp.]MCH4109508.1 M20/M25/M40 family metallo-hydrolase [Eubacterium sp.]MCI1306604.1 M20/M25/M40 family metallo-hydrolase [Eubacterium sp.]